ncbi:MAG: hypothetical protein ACR2LN_08100 [Candidatus Levyibacteriota bacterium]
MTEAFNGSGGPEFKAPGTEKPQAGNGKIFTLFERLGEKAANSTTLNRLGEAATNSRWGERVVNSKALNRLAEAATNSPTLNRLGERGANSRKLKPST